MQPLLNLKSFLAVLLTLILPGSLLVAYFRDYSPGAGGHVHSEMGKGDGAALGKDGDSSAASEHDSMAMPQNGQMSPKQRANSSQQPVAQSDKEGGHDAMGHAKTAQPSTAQAQPQQPQAPSQSGAALAPDQLNVAMPGARAGIPGASHLYHVGATDFFLDHSQHITLSTEQWKCLNRIKEQAALNKASANRKVQEAEQQLWKLTALAQPDTAQIEAKIREIEKLHVAQRLAFIRPVGDAAKVLTEEQTKILLGKAAPVMPDAKPAPPGNKPSAKPAAESAHPLKP